MLKDIMESTYETEEWYELVFDDGHNNGFGFPANEAGDVLLELNKAALENYRYCMDHPEKFKRWNEVVKYSRRYRVPAKGTCSCGQEVVLINEYMGACECPNCGKWYNLFGQELLPPDQWDMSDDWN